MTKNIRNKKMELSYILNNGVDINREAELNNSINDITRTCMNFNGSTVVFKRANVKSALNTIVKSRNKKEIKHSIHKLKYIQQVQSNYITNIINILTKSESSIGRK